MRLSFQCGYSVCHFSVDTKCTMGCVATGTRAFVHGGLSNFVLDDLYAVDLTAGAWIEVGLGAPVCLS